MMSPLPAGTGGPLRGSAKLLSPWKPRRVPRAREVAGGMGAAGLGGAGDQTVGEWEGPSAPGGGGGGGARARAGSARGRGVQGEHRGFRPPTRDARGSEAASQLPWEGCPYSSSGASVARSQPGGNRTWCSGPQAAPLSRQPMRAPFCPPPCPPPGASRQLGAGPAGRPR